MSTDNTRMVARLSYMYVTNQPIHPLSHVSKESNAAMTGQPTRMSGDPAEIPSRFLAFRDTVKGVVIVALCENITPSSSYMQGIVIIRAPPHTSYRARDSDPLFPLRVVVDIKANTRCTDLQPADTIYTSTRAHVYVYEV